MTRIPRQQARGRWATIVVLLCACSAAAQDDAATLDPAAEADRHRTGDYVVTQPGVLAEAYKDALRGYRWKLKDEYRVAVREKQPFLPDLLRPGQDMTWQVSAPDTYTPGDAHGVLVYIHPADSGRVHPFIHGQLGERKLVAIGADHAGNAQDPAFRHAAAVHAVDLIRRRYDVDEDRVYVHGLSGGGRMASRVVFLEGHVFDGAIALIGCDPYLQIPAGQGRNTVYRGFWPTPDRKRLEHVKEHNRIVLVTGEHDANRPGTLRVYEAYKKERFAHVSYLEEPGLGHEYPSADYLRQALDLLDAPLLEGAAEAYEKAQAFEEKNRPGEARTLYTRAAKYGRDAEWVPEAQAKAVALQVRCDQDLAALEALFADETTPIPDLIMEISRFRRAWDPDEAVVDRFRQRVADRRAADTGN